MLKTIKYIGAVALVGLPFMACTDDFASDTTNGEYTISETGEKTPLEMAVTLQDSYAGPRTRALNGAFEKGDKLVAYVEQVAKGNTDADGQYTGSISNKTLVSKKVEFTVVALGDDPSTVKTENLGVALYWDDFSNTSDDITASDRYLRVGYGFCYNGGTPDPSTGDNSGVVGWSVQLDQTTENFANVRKSDLLWAGPQTAVKYDPAKVRPDVSYENKVKLPVTYTHAMSKVTIELVLADGFEKKEDTGKAIAFENATTTPTLYANAVATVDAPQQLIKSTQQQNVITMYLTDDESTPGTRVYEAIIAPTVMKAGNVLATVEVDGNKYDLTLTDALLTTLPTGDTREKWSSKLSAYETSDESTLVYKKDGVYSSSDGGITLSGINYRLKATLKKQRIEVEAKITDWTDVSASIEGSIMFDPDVRTNVFDPDPIDISKGSFDLWRAVAKNGETVVAKANADYDADATTNGVNKASTYEYKGGKWDVAEGSPVLYWVNGNTPYYFRALATAKTTDSTTGIVTELQHVDCSDGKDGTDAAQGTDLLWAQTSKHKGKDPQGNYVLENGQPKVYEPGDAIDPRTGNVPLTFQHAMSKISFQLVTAENAGDVDHVDLSGATISIINIYNKGKINVGDGTIGSLDMTLTEEEPIYTIKGTVDASFKWENQIVIPQSLTTDKDGAARSKTPLFYTSNELTAIYPDADPKYGDVSVNTSIGTGTPTYYLTSELGNPVPAVLYTSSTDDIAAINDYNKTIDGHVLPNDDNYIRVPEQPEVLYVGDNAYIDFNKDQHHSTFSRAAYSYLVANCKEAVLKNQEIPASVYQGYTEFHQAICNDPLVPSWYNDLPKEFKQKDSESDEEYTYVEFSQAISGSDLSVIFEERWSSKIKGTDFNKIPNTYKPAEYFEDNDADYTEYINRLQLTPEQFAALPNEEVTLANEEKYKFKVKTPYAAAQLYTEEEANAYNAKLPGAIGVGSVKIPAHYKLPSTAPDPHTVGSLEDRGDKIMLYVTLTDGTRYNLELSECLTEVNGVKTTVDEWNPGEHYVYTIKLLKEKITFRALLQDWVKRETQGEATLDWD